MPTYCLPLVWPRQQLCAMLLLWIAVLLVAEARRRQLVSPSVRQETVGSERVTATLWIGHSVRGECGDVLWSENGLPACLLCHFNLHSWNFSIEKTRANDFFFAPVSPVLKQPFGILVFDRLNGMLEKNTVAQLHRQWVSTWQSKPEIAQRCTYQPMASCLFISFLGSQMLVDINWALFLETDSD